MRRIFKYELHVEDKQYIQSFNYFDPLGVEIQNGKPVLYAIVDDDTKPRQYIIRTYGTGMTLDNDDGSAMFIGRYKLMGDSLVYHVFWKNW